MDRLYFSLNRHIILSQSIIQRNLFIRTFFTRSLFGWQQDEYDVHKFDYYFELLHDILLDFGFDEIENLTNSGNGLENEPWHLEVQAVKLEDAKPHKNSRFYTHFNVNH